MRWGRLEYIEEVIFESGTLFLSLRGVVNLLLSSLVWLRCVFAVCVREVKAQTAESDFCLCLLVFLSFFFLSFFLSD